MRQLLVFLLLCVVFFSCDYDIYHLPSEIPVKTFTLNSHPVPPCMFVVLEDTNLGERDKYYVSPYDGCIHFSDLTNGTKYRIYRPEGAGCSLSYAGEFVVNAKENVGCAACENINTLLPSSLLISKDEHVHRIYVNAFYENNSIREPLKHAGLIVWIKNLTYSKLCKIVTDDTGLAYIDYDPDVVMDYYFAYCCYYADCGFKECLHALNVPKSLIDSYNSLSDLPDCSGGSTGTLDDPVRLFPSVESITILPRQVNPQGFFCFPAMLVLSFLFAAMLLMGRNPLSPFDLSTPMLRKHTTYVPRGAQVGFKPSGLGVVRQVSSTLSSMMGKAKEMAKAEKGKKLAEVVKGKGEKGQKNPMADHVSGLKYLGKHPFKVFGALIKDRFGFGDRGRGKKGPKRVVGGLLQMVEGVVTFNKDRIKSGFHNVVGTKVTGEREIKTGGRADQQFGTFMGAQGTVVLGLFGLRHLTRIVGAFKSLARDLKNASDKKSRIGAFLKFLSVFSGLDYAISFGKDLYTIARRDVEFARLIKEQRGDPNKINDAIEERYGKKVNDALKELTNHPNDEKLMKKLETAQKDYYEMKKRLDIYTRIHDLSGAQYAEMWVVGVPLAMVGFSYFIENIEPKLSKERRKKFDQWTVGTPNISILLSKDAVDKLNVDNNEAKETIEKFYSGKKVTFRELEDALNTILSSSQLTDQQKQQFTQLKKAFVMLKRSRLGQQSVAVDVNTLPSNLRDKNVISKMNNLDKGTKSIFDKIYSGEKITFNELQSAASMVSMSPQLSDQQKQQLKRILAFSFLQFLPSNVEEAKRQDIINTAQKGDLDNVIDGVKQLLEQNLSSEQISLNLQSILPAITHATESNLNLVFAKATLEKAKEDAEKERNFSEANGYEYLIKQIDESLKESYKQYNLTPDDFRIMMNKTNDYLSAYQQEVQQKRMNQEVEFWKLWKNQENKEKVDPLQNITIKYDGSSKQFKIGEMSFSKDEIIKTASQLQNEVTTDQYTESMNLPVFLYRKLTGKDWTSIQKHLLEKGCEDLNHGKTDTPEAKYTVMVALGELGRTNKNAKKAYEIINEAYQSTLSKNADNYLQYQAVKYAGRELLRQELMRYVQEEQQGEREDLLTHLENARKELESENPYIKQDLNKFEKDLQRLRERLKRASIEEQSEESLGGVSPRFQIPSSICTVYGYKLYREKQHKKDDPFMQKYQKYLENHPNPFEEQKQIGTWEVALSAFYNIVKPKDQIQKSITNDQNTQNKINNKK